MAPFCTGYRPCTNEHIVFVGLMGSGKTTAGRIVAAATGRPLVDCDDALTARAGRTAAQIAADDGVDALHRLEAEVLLDALAAEKPTVVTAAASTIDDPRCRDALAPVHVVWLRGDPATLASRVRAQKHRPLDDDVEAQLAEQAARRYPLYERVADAVLDVD